MKIGIGALTLFTCCTATLAFAPSLKNAVQVVVHPTTQLNAINNDHDNNNKSFPDQVKNVMASTLMAAALWASPTALFNNIDGPAAVTDNMLFNTIHSSVVADAKEMASASGSRVNKDAESLLRLGLPIPKDKEVRKLQTAIEEIRQDIQTKRKAAAIDGVKKVQKTLKTKSTDFTNMCRDTTECTSIITSMNDLFVPLDASLKDAQTSQNGSDQERAALDSAYKTYDTLQKLLTSLEEQMVPAGYETPVPDSYNDLPQLRGGRATVEFVLQKPGNAPFDIEGVNFPEAKLKMVIDGFTAPVTGGNFVDLVQKGFYTNMNIQRSDGFVVQTGDPVGPADGYVGTPSKSIGKGKHGERLIPSEIFPKGDKGPFYETTIEDEGRGGEATVLPFSSYGAMGWAREEYDANSGSSQFFWLLFDSDLTPAGKNVLDGRYPCFGYVVEGADFLSDIKEDDVIVSAKVTSGLDKLVLPKTAEEVTPNLAM
jgi:peptidylprolyl isomerase